MNTIETALVVARAQKAPRKIEQTLEHWIADVQKQYPKSQLQVVGDTASFHVRKGGIKLVATWNDETKSGWIRPLVDNLG